MEANRLSPDRSGHCRAGHFEFLANPKAARQGLESERLLGSYSSVREVRSGDLEQGTDGRVGYFSDIPTYHSQLASQCRPPINDE
jgi:hypothetical protein